MPVLVSVDDNEKIDDESKVTQKSLKESVLCISDDIPMVQQTQQHPLEWK